MLSGRFGSFPDGRNLRDCEYIRRFQVNISFSKCAERMVALILLKAYRLDQAIKTHSCDSFVSVSASYPGVRYLVINRVYLSKVTESWTQMEGSVQGIKVQESWGTLIRLRLCTFTKRHNIKECFSLQLSPLV